jgi:hypothetical protein
MAAFALGFAIIAAAWLTQLPAASQAIGLVFLVASVVGARVARAMITPRVTAATEWGRAACVFLAELAIYAGLAGGVTLAAASVTGQASAGSGATDGLAGPFGPMLQGGIVDRLGGHGAAGVWMMAVVAAVILALHHVADLCSAGPAARMPRLGSLRLLLAGAAAILVGPRLAVLVALLLSLLGLLYTLVRPADTETLDTPVIAGYRGDGPLSAWIGGWVNGRLPPAPPLMVGLLVTCMLAALGLRNLPGILVLTPAEAMLLATLGSSHLHDGRGDWRVPPLLQAGEYVFLGAAGYAGHVAAPVTFGLIAAVGLRHLDMAYRARNRVPLSWFMERRWRQVPRADWRGFGWEGRMILAGIALMGGITSGVYLVLAAYLFLLAAADYLASWSNASLPAYAPAPAPGGHHPADG